MIYMYCNLLLFIKSVAQFKTLGVSCDHQETYLINQNIDPAIHE